MPTTDPTTDPADVARTQQRSRIVALGLGVVAFGMALAVRLLLAPRLDGARYENTLMFLGPGAVALLLFAVHAALFRPASRRRPAAFQLGRVRGRPAFVGAVPPIDHAPVPVFAALATVLVALDRTPSGDSALPASFVAASVLAAIGAVAAAAWFTLFRRPFLVLTPDELSVRWTSGLLQARAYTFAWDALAPGGPSPTGETAIWLLVDFGHPTANGARSLAPPGYSRYRLDTRRILIDPTFLAHSIRYYRDHPAARAGIGTAAGHAQLVAAVLPQPGAEQSHRPMS